MHEPTSDEHTNINPVDSSLEQSYDEYARIEEAFQQFLDGSLDPRGPDSLFDLVAPFDLPADEVAVDVGCGEGREGLELVTRFGLRVHAIDPVQRNIERAADMAAAAG